MLQAGVYRRLPDLSVPKKHDRVHRDSSEVPSSGRPPLPSGLWEVGPTRAVLGGAFQVKSGGITRDGEGVAVSAPAAISGLQGDSWNC